MRNHCQTKAFGLSCLSFGRKHREPNLIEDREKYVQFLDRPKNGSIKGKLFRKLKNTRSLSLPFDSAKILFFADQL